MFALSQRAHIASIFNVPASLVQLRELFGTNDKAMYDPSFMVESFQSLVVGLHDFVGFGWAPTLLVCATGFRIMTLPLYAKSVLVGRRRSEAGSELAELRSMARDAVFLRDPKLLESVDKEYKNRLSARGLTNNPFQGLGYTTLIQFPWTITMFLSLRDMSTHADLFKDFTVNSATLWCPSLALPDPYGILPLLSSFMVLRNLHASTNRSQNNSVIDPVRLKYVLSGATLTFLPWLMQLPSGIIMFFILNTAFNRLVTPWIMRLHKPS